MFTLPFWIFPAFFITALIYATVGLAGGSSYLAFLTLTRLPLAEVAAIALFCNSVVAAGGVWHFSRAGQMRFKMLLPFLITSIPAAYFGGLFKAEESMHRIVLGLCLLLAAWRIWYGNSGASVQTRRTTGAAFWGTALLAGSGLGFFSGFLGIGGGIFLSPLLILAGWATTKESSAAAALFILLNSAAGLFARWHFLQAHVYECIIFGVVVFAGGQLGSRAGAYHLPDAFMRQLTAGFISWVSLRLLWMAL